MILTQGASNVRFITTAFIWFYSLAFATTSPTYFVDLLLSEFTYITSPVSGQIGLVER